MSSTCTAALATANHHQHHQQQEEDHVDASSGGTSSVGGPNWWVQIAASAVVGVVLAVVLLDTATTSTRTTTGRLLLPPAPPFNDLGADELTMNEGRAAATTSTESDSSTTTVGRRDSNDIDDAVDGSASSTGSGFTSCRRQPQRCAFTYISMVMSARRLRHMMAEGDATAGEDLWAAVHSATQLRRAYPDSPIVLVTNYDVQGFLLPRVLQPYYTQAHAPRPVCRKISSTTSAGRGENSRRTTDGADRPAEESEAVVEDNDELVFACTTSGSPATSGRSGGIPTWNDTSSSTEPLAFPFTYVVELPLFRRALLHPRRRRKGSDSSSSSRKVEDATGGAAFGMDRFVLKPDALQLDFFFAPPPSPRRGGLAMSSATEAGAQKQTKVIRRGGSGAQLMFDRVMFLDSDTIPRDVSLPTVIAGAGGVAGKKKGGGSSPSSVAAALMGAVERAATRRQTETDKRNSGEEEHRASHLDSQLFFTALDSVGPPRSSSRAATTQTAKTSSTSSGSAEEASLLPAIAMVPEFNAFRDVSPYLYHALLRDRQVYPPAPGSNANSPQPSYDPAKPLFRHITDYETQFNTGLIAFAPTKGVRRLLEAWRRVHRRLPWCRGDRVAWDQCSFPHALRLLLPHGGSGTMSGGQKNISDRRSSGIAGAGNAGRLLRVGILSEVFNVREALGRGCSPFLYPSQGKGGGDGKKKKSKKDTENGTKENDSSRSGQGDCRRTKGGMPIDEVRAAVLVMDHRSELKAQVRRRLMAGGSSPWWAAPPHSGHDDKAPGGTRTSGVPPVPMACFGKDEAPVRCG